MHLKLQFPQLSLSFCKLTVHPASAIGDAEHWENPGLHAVGMHEPFMQSAVKTLERDEQFLSQEPQVSDAVKFASQPFTPFLSQSPKPDEQL